ncbi:conserved membrane hypothetical protein [Azospirillaceae bacterium]
MELLKGDAGPVFIVLYLLPGFLGTVVYDYLAVGEKPSLSERIFHVLALDLLSSLLVHVVFGVPLGVFAEVAENASVTEFIEIIVRNNLLYLSMAAIVISVGFSVINNNNALYRILNRFKITDKAGSVDVWQEAFRNNRRTWVRVTFASGRLLIGWPRLYSLTGKPRELFLSEATWWTPKGNGEFSQEDVVGAGVYLSDFSEVTVIELLK